MKIKLFFIISILLLMSACTSSGSQTTSANDAVTFDFLTNLPPQTQIYENQKFRIGMNVINYDETKKQVSICIYDSISDFAGGIPSKVCDNLELNPAYKSGDQLIGENEKIYFPSKEEFYEYINIDGDLDTNIFADLYYPHITIAKSQICIKRDVDITPTGIKCDLNSVEEVTNNNAPIKVSNLKKDVIPMGKGQVNVLLTFDISNVGMGKVVDRESIFSEQESINPKMDVGVYLLRTTPIKFECIGLYDGKLLFKENQKTIICESMVDLNDEFSNEQIKIVLDYGYKIEKLTSNIKLIDKDII